jgi:hypothetical protein
MQQEFARILYAGTLPSLGNAKLEDGGFKRWVVSGAYIPKQEANGDLLLQRVGVEVFSRAVAFDYDRFALSAQESRIVALAEREKFGIVSWPLLKQYYSAFFSAHAIMRSRGAGIARIDASQSSAIMSTLKDYLGSDAKFASGNYYFSISKGEDDLPGEITVSLSASKDGKGVHEGFWISFVKYLAREAERAVQDGLVDNQLFLGYSYKIKEAIMAGESPWISRVRNEINYQHEHQSWMPLTKKSVSNLSIPRSSINYSANSRLDVARQSDEIKAFFSVCCYLSELNLEIATRIAARSKAGGSFGQRWDRLNNNTGIPA